MMMNKGFWKAVAWTTAGLAAAAVLVIFHRFNPARGGFFPPCVFHEVTGLHCSGCGAQRALHHLLNGHPLAALDSNPLVMLAPIVVVPILLWRRRWVHHPAMPWVVVVTLVGFSVARNLPWWPFTVLAP